MRKTVVVVETLESDITARLQEALREVRTVFVPIAQLHAIDLSETEHLAACLELESLRTVMALAAEHGLTLGVVPMPHQEALRRTFDLPKRWDDAVATALRPATKSIDVLRCESDVVVLESVIGEVPPLDRYKSDRSSTFGLFVRTLKRIRTLRHVRLTLQDETGRSKQVSATGAVILEYDNTTFASKLVRRYVHAADGLGTAVLLAPVSAMQYLSYVLRTFFSTQSTLPSSVGYTRFERLEVASEPSAPVSIDGSVRFQTPVTFRVEPEALRLSVGEGFWERQSASVASKKSEKLDHLPSDEESVRYLTKAIPWLSHASQEAYGKLLPTLREEARLGSTFSVLLVLATLIATFGLFIDSASVIIGAMLLAPLMQPIVSLSMGVLRLDASLAKRAFFTVVAGVAMVLAASMGVALSMPLHHLTSEMAGRLSPTLLDLFVAIVSGAAAAYAKSNEKISASLAGVAIAVALVPPIAVAGIGLGWGSYAMFASAFLLFTTNLVGIVLAAAATFTLLGYAPFHVAKKSIVGWLVVVAVVAVPLYRSFQTMEHQSDLIERLSASRFVVGQRTVTLEEVRIVPKKEGKWQVQCDAISDGVLNQSDKEALKRAIVRRAGEEVETVVALRYKL